MTQLRDMTTPELVVEFIAAARERGAAVLDSQAPRANRMYARMKEIDSILRARGQEARLALEPLLNSSERFVRYYAAIYLLGAAPEKARKVIEEVAEPNFDALSGEAGMTLFSLDNGIFKPD
jgi:uncharacterized protein DUF2019